MLMGKDEDRELKDRAIIKRVRRDEGFMRSVIEADSVEDWAFAKDLGDFLVRTMPDEVMGHLVLARSSPHFSHGSQEDRFRLARCSIWAELGPHRVKRCQH